MASQTRSIAPASPPVYIIDGARTPFLKARGRPGPFTPVDMAVQCGRPLLMRNNLPPSAFDQVILGCVNVISEEMNPARVAALRLGMGEAMPAFTVQINCGSGMQSIDTAYKYIRDGSADLILAGGAEALSHSPLLLQQNAVHWLADFQRAKSLGQRLDRIIRFRPWGFKPVIGLESGLTDAIAELNMGQTADVSGTMIHINGAKADEHAVASHQRLAGAQTEGRLTGEVTPGVGRDGTLDSADDGVRPDSSVEHLATLKPVFERPYGKVTAGNSSQITDGASWVIVASEAAVKKYQLTPRAVIVDSHWSALDPQIMGLAPVLAAGELLKRRELELQDIDLWELNEAFAAQVLACLAAFDDADFNRLAFGRETPFGRIDRDRLNIDGGAVSLGHPVGTSGNRIVLHLVNAMQRQGLTRGIATQCIGGGLAGAMLIETV